MNQKPVSDYLAALMAETESTDEALNQADMDALIAERLNALAGETLSEAERSAAAADKPKERKDGHPLGSVIPRRRQLTDSQHKFAQGLIEGKTYRQAYRDAYPNAQCSDASASAQASKLSRDPRIQKLIRDAWEETQEALADDLVATKRFVMKSLLHMVKTGKQETTRLRALELMGKASGAFNLPEAEKDKPLSADELKKELAGHLKLMGNVKPIKPKVA